MSWNGYFWLLNGMRWAKKVSKKNKKVSKKLQKVSNSIKKVSKKCQKVSRIFWMALNSPSHVLPKEVKSLTSWSNCSFPAFTESGEIKFKNFDKFQRLKNLQQFLKLSKKSDWTWFTRSLCDLLNKTIYDLIWGKLPSRNSRLIFM